MRLQRKLPGCPEGRAPSGPQLGGPWGGLVHGFGLHAPGPFGQIALANEHEPKLCIDTTEVTPSGHWDGPA